MKRLALAAAAIAAAFTLPACATPGAGGLARITVIDRTANRELPVHWKDGRAYVAGQPGNEYAVRVRNVAGEDLLAVVSVDGVNAITGESAQAAQSGYVVGSYTSMDVSGWRKNMQRTAAFYFTTLPDSYAARTGRPDDVGVIGVALFRRKPPEPVAVEPWRPMPFAKQESSVRRAGARRTGLGGAAGIARLERQARGPGGIAARNRPRPRRTQPGTLGRLRARHALPRRDDHDLLRQRAQPGGAGRDPAAVRPAARPQPVPGLRARSRLALPVPARRARRVTENGVRSLYRKLTRSIRAFQARCREIME